MRIIQNFQLGKNTKIVTALNLGYLSRTAFDIFERILDCHAICSINDVHIDLWQVNYSNFYIFQRKYLLPNELGETNLFFESNQHGLVNRNLNNYSKNDAETFAVNLTKNFLENYIKSVMNDRNVTKGDDYNKKVQKKLDDATLLLRHLFHQRHIDSFEGKPFNPFESEVYKERLSIFLKHREKTINCTIEEDEKYVPLEKQAYYDMVNMLE